MALKALKLKPLPGAYIKVGCHHHHLPRSLNKVLNKPVRGQVRGVEVREAV